MISVHMVVDIAFCVAFLLALWPACRFISKFLADRKSSISKQICDAEMLRDKSSSTLKGLMSETYDSSFEAEIQHILSNAHEEARLLVMRSKDDLEKMLVERLEIAARGMSEDVSRECARLLEKCVDIAIIATQETIGKKFADDPSQNNAVIAMLSSGLSRDLKKPLD